PTAPSRAWRTRERGSGPPAQRSRHASANLLAISSGSSARTRPHGNTLEGRSKRTRSATTRGSKPHRRRRVVGLPTRPLGRRAQLARADAAALRFLLEVVGGAAAVPDSLSRATRDRS